MFKTNFKLYLKTLITVFLRSIDIVGNTSRTLLEGIRQD